MEHYHRKCFGLDAFEYLWCCPTEWGNLEPTRTPFQGRLASTNNVVSNTDNISSDVWGPFGRIMYMYGKAAIANLQIIFAD